MIKIGKKIVLVFLFLFSISNAALTVKSSVSSTEIPLNGSFVFQVVIESDKNIGLSQPNLPAIKGFNFLGKSQSSQYSVVNGRRSYVKSFKYTMEPKLLGRLVVPSLTLTIAGTSYRTSNHVLNVTKGNNVKNNIANLPSVFMKAEINKKTVYVGEPLQYKAKLYYRVRLFDASYNEPSYKGAVTKKDNSLNSNYREFISGREYIVDEVSTIIIPSYASSKIEIPPSSMTYQTSFFESSKKVSTDKLSYSVKPLPHTDDNSFTGAVGDYELFVSPASITVKAGDAITLNIMIKGFGNIENVVLPDIKINNDIKDFGSKESAVSSIKDGKLYGLKSKEYVLVPSLKGNYNLGNYRFSWFSPKNKKFVSRTVRLPHIKVLKGAVVNHTIKNGDEKTAIEKTGDDIRYIKRQVSDSYFFIHKSIYFYIVIFIFYLFCLLLIVYKILLYFNMFSLIKNYGSPIKKHMKLIRIANKELQAGDESAAAEKATEYIRKVLSDIYRVPESGITSSSIAAFSDNSKILVDIYNQLESINYSSENQKIIDQIHMIPKAIERMSE